MRSAKGNGLKRHLRRLIPASGSSWMKWIELLVAAALVVLLGLISPYGCGVASRTSQTRALANAKQIYLGLKMYAGDHDGHFPDKTVDGKPLTNANEAYRNLVPDYIPKEQIFYLKGSAWTPKPPDENTTPGHALVAGENHFAYVPHLTDNSNRSFPLIADGFKEDEPGVYTADSDAKGGVWKGKHATVIRVDGSGQVATLTPDFKIPGPVNSAAPTDLFAPAPGWLDATQKPLNPE